MNVGTMTRVALMAAVTAVAAQIAIPIPFSPVPFTLQVLAVILAGLLLGPRNAALAMAVYLLVGAVGVPVFSEFRGGLGHLLGPTGGYLISYPLAAAVAGLAAASTLNTDRRRALTLGFLLGAAGLTIIYTVGATWLSVITGISIPVAIAQGVLPFVAFDLVKVALAVAVGTAAAPAIATSRA
ncbi:MAG: biotin transporter BioY [Rubrobacteraceae bacterium]